MKPEYAREAPMNEEEMRTEEREKTRQNVTWTGEMKKILNERR